MKKLIIFLVFATAAYSEEVKKPETPPQPTERVLTETELLKLQLAAAKIQIIHDRYKFDDMQKELKPIVDEQNSVAMAMCQSIGIPPEMIQTQCGINLGTDQAGKQVMGPDGKPVQARVWWNRPSSVPVPSPASKSR